MDREFSDEDMEAFLMATAERQDLGLWDEGVAAMSGPKQTFVLIWDLDNEVHNGGFRQYAWNSSGEGVPYVIEALKQIEAHNNLRIVQQALDLIGETDWADEETRRAHVDELSEAVEAQLDALDQAYYRWEDNHTRLLFRYVMNNIGAFPPPQA
ncbi:MAG TPA: DUF4375 domain-containing protein [Asticcacaulis sp.]|nr:DUF4375 domain-containing protein [Asticcacaulis sp.]